MNWSPVLNLLHQCLWVLPFLAVLALFTGIGNRKSAKNLGSDRIEFSPGWVHFVASAVVALYAVQGAVEAYQRHHMLAGTTLVALILLIALCFPGTIVLDNRSIRQIFWFRKNKCIQWGQVVEVSAGKKKRVVTITGMSGTKIIHWNMLPDRARLLHEIQRHRSGNMPPDFPRGALSSGTQS